MNLLLGISAAPTKAKTIFANIGRWPRRFCALFTGGGLVPHVDAIPLAPVFVTQTFSPVFTPADSAKAWWPVNQCVFGGSAAEPQIPDPVVVPNLIDVVDLFFVGEQSPKFLLHPQPMLQHITSAVTAWVVWSKNFYVSIGILVGVAGLKVGPAFHCNDVSKIQS